MRLTEIQRQYGTKQSIFEAKSRIEHPEDLIFTNGYLGAKSAVESLLSAATVPQLSQIKWDGAPAGIAGRYNGQFTLTDKRGFAHYKNGLPHSEKELKDAMFNRHPDSPGREQFSINFSRLFPLLERAIPKTFSGFIQFDVLWFSKPLINNKNYQFKPNKIVYEVPVDSALGKQISKSQLGIVVHSYFKSPDQDEPIAVTKLSDLHLNLISQLVILGPTTVGETTVPDAEKPCKELLQYMRNQQNKIDSFFSPETLRGLKITNLGNLMKSFLAYKAGKGQRPLLSVSTEFLKFLPQIAGENKSENIKKYISSNIESYKIVWKIVLGIIFIKNMIKKSFDKSTSSNIVAKLDGNIGHEGYVSSTPTGKIKLVDRPIFMRHTEN
jgi:hypothetical protein